MLKLTISLTNLFLRLAPITALILLLLVGFRLANSQGIASEGISSEGITTDALNPLPAAHVEKSITDADVVASPGESANLTSENSASDHSESSLIEAKSEFVESEDNSTDEANLKDDATPKDQASPKDQESVWADISNAIISLNGAVGVEMFLELSRAQKGQMEVRLDKSYWDRVQYQTRVSLKSDISDLWHLYAKEYNYAESSVVYFIDDQTGKVIDIFSKAN